MKVSSTKITRLWNEREVLFDKLGRIIVGISFIAFIIALIIRILLDGESNNWIWLLVDIAALFIILNGIKDQKILVNKLKGIPLVSHKNVVNPFEHLEKNKENEILEKRYEKILRRYN